MCSIAIPSERMLGHSPPVYGPLLYSSLMVTTPPTAIRAVPPQIRPCLAASTTINIDGLLKGSDDANKRNKKRVVFADDRGRPLTQVRVMSEPSNMPPLWTSAYVASLARGELFRNLDGSLSIYQEPAVVAAAAALACRPGRPLDQLHGDEGAEASAAAAANPWEPSFAQPASDYLAFRAKLDQSSVSLENVIVRDAEKCLVGTVKVKNMAYDKLVTIRVTSDGWASHEDVECTYVELPGLASSAAVRNLYDTFRFRIELPEDGSSHQIEFCVRYTTQGADYWDNNAGANYVVKKKRHVTTEEKVAELLRACCGPTATHNGFSQPPNRRNKAALFQPAPDVSRVQLRTWSEFAAWQHLENDGPYW